LAAGKSKNSFEYLAAELGQLKGTAMKVYANASM
jgi:hypothetical protein